MLVITLPDGDQHFTSDEEEQQSESQNGTGGESGIGKCCLICRRDGCREFSRIRGRDQVWPARIRQACNESEICIEMALAPLKRHRG